MVKVSVILATYRWGGLDVSFAGLHDQTFKDYEVILCDVHYHKRKDAVAEYAKKFDIPLVHVHAFRTQNPLDSSEFDRNSAIAYAEGDLSVFLCDYGFTQRDFVEKHWRFYEKNKYVTAMAPHRYRLHPEIKPNWEGEPISLFTKEFTQDMLPALPIQDGGQDPKITMGAGGIDYTYCHLKNESFPTELLLEMNGCDEGYNTNGGHLFGDTDLARRAMYSGHSFVLDPTNLVEIVQIRDIYPILQRNRSGDDDHAYLNMREGKGHVLPDEHNGFNMRKLREEMIKCKPRLR